MDVETFLTEIEKLTGTEIKEVRETEERCLRNLLGNDDRIIDCSQFNELLLLVNKDRVRLPFFSHFFGKTCRLADVPKGIRRFQEAAMFLFGNFVRAYRRLSRIDDEAALRRELGDVAADRDQEIQRLKERRPKLLEIESIHKDETVLLGYLSSVEIVGDQEESALLRDLLNKSLKDGKGSLRILKASFSGLPDASQRAESERIVGAFERVRGTDSVAKFGSFLDESSQEIRTRVERLKAAQAIGERNQDVYLTWDHMDVYFATSMRKPWEFRELHDFIQQTMSAPEVAELNLRYFDPTQSYTKNRINKGLIESLMLKRAKCTVYSVQESDTLGKDSELAATLAQGKPVIAFVPQVDVGTRVNELMKQDRIEVLERLLHTIQIEGAFRRSLDAEDSKLIQDFEKLAEDGRIWRSIRDKNGADDLNRRLNPKFKRICGILAEAEERIYDNRARTFRNFHPLALQVNLDTGVANGVLVTRTPGECIALLRRVVTRSMEFEVAADDELWYLREPISNCIFRVVTKDRKLSNCFWNFYNAAGR